MEATKFCLNAGIRLPIGYRFRPTDEELVLHYLRPKVFGILLPASIIPNFDVFLTSPWDLPGDVKERRYFFSKVNMINLDDKSCKIEVAGSGYWKPVGKDKKIAVPGTNIVVGTRTTFVFHQRKCSSHGLKTRWFMHRYGLMRPEATSQCSNKMLLNNVVLEDWAVCCVFQRKRGPKTNKAILESPIHLSSRNIRDFLVQNTSDMGPPQSCSSCSSAVTEDTSYALDQEANSACRGPSYSSMEKQ